MIELDKKQAGEFLAKNNIHDFEIVKVAGDASFRSYYRIFCADKKFILMFAPPKFEDIKPFIKIDEFLIAHDFSAPKIFASDENFGFILLEDFGDDVYTKVLKKFEPDNQELELELYQRACDCLIGLHKIKPANLPFYNNALLYREVMLFIDWYLLGQKKEMSLADKALFKNLWFELFDQLDKENQVTVLRDYHADNLMVLSDRIGYKKVGLLDFQDAVIGSKAYDLVSLLEDARRDLNEKNRAMLLNYYLEKSACDKESFLRDYEILSLQRNIKIIGIFSRLSIRDSKHYYLSLLPRVLNFIVLRLNSKNQIFSEMSKLLQKFV
ncbi:MAG: aminoglycoside phosphotransferase [Proteobacteria bacterium]|nr:aminoglycoside phosphotransferase [Pseudomonadota bacterium]